MSPCICLTGPVVLHEGHCCFRGPNPTCHEPEIAALRPPGYVPPCPPPPLTEETENRDR